LAEDRFAAGGITLKVSLPTLNAVDSTPDGGWVVVTAERDGKARQGKGGLSLVVADTGIGPTPAGVSNEADSGLAMVQSMIELHDGEFLIYTPAGKGTTVCLTFPKSRVDVGDDVAQNGTA